MDRPDREKRGPRVATRIEAVLIDSDGGRLDVTIVDILSGGFRLQTSETLQVGEHVRLWTSRHGEVPAAIIWAEGLQAGGVFLEPVRL